MFFHNLLFNLPMIFMMLLVKFFAMLLLFLKLRRPVIRQLGLLFFHRKGYCVWPNWYNYFVLVLVMEAEFIFTLSLVFEMLFVMM